MPVKRRQPDPALSSLARGAAAPILRNDCEVGRQIPNPIVGVELPDLSASLGLVEKRPRCKEAGLGRGGSVTVASVPASAPFHV